MPQTKKGNQWYHRWAEGCAYGMKVHLGVDKGSGLIHPVVTTAARVHHLSPRSDRLHGEEGGGVCRGWLPGIERREEKEGKTTKLRIARRPDKRLALPDTPDRRLEVGGDGQGPSMGHGGASLWSTPSA